MDTVHVFDLINQIVDDFHTCRINAGIEKWDRIISDVLDMMGYYTSNEPNTEIIKGLNQALLLIEDSMKNCDYVLTADVFENELLPCLKEMI